MKTRFLLLILVFFVAFTCDIAFGSVNLSLKDVWSSLTGSGGDDLYREIIINYRLPKALTAILTGAALSVAGVLMQTLFRNPLAGPDVLGVTSGASLGVALLTLGASSLPWFVIAGWGQVTAAVLGAVGGIVTDNYCICESSADYIFINYRYDVWQLCRSHCQHSAKHQ